MLASLLSTCFCAVARSFDAYQAISHADELGLTADQKTKLEAIREEQYGRLETPMPYENMTPDQIRAEARELRESETKRVGAILTPAQQHKLRDLEYPKRSWDVSGYIHPGEDASHFDVRFDSHVPPEYLSYSIHRKNIRLSATSDGKTIIDPPFLALDTGTRETLSPIPDKDGWPEIHLTLVVDRRSMKPGLYHLGLKTAVDATDTETGKSVDLPAVTAWSYARIYCPPQPDAEPSLTPGQRFIGSPWSEVDASDTAYKDVKTGKPIKWKHMNCKVLVLQKVEPVGGGNRLILDLEGHSGQISLVTSATATTLPYLAPLLTEPNVRALKAQYEGKNVWCYGGAGGQCISSDSNVSISMAGRADLPMRIRHIERMYLPYQEMAIGAATFMGGERRSAFVTNNPLIVILDPPAKGLELNGFMSVSKPTALDGKGFPKDMEDLLPKEVKNPRAYCLGLMNTFADKWDFEREYSLQSPLVIGKKWPAKMRKAVLEGEVVKGMTREMVAWVMGWPNIYGTKQEMLKLNDWTYDNIPSDGHIYFKNGVVSSESWPRLP